MNIKEFLDSKSFLDHHSIGILKTELGKQEGKIKHNNHEIDISSLKELPTEIIYSFIINKSLDAKTIYKLKRTLSQDIRRALLNMALKHCRYKILDAWLTKKSLFFLRVDPLYHDLKQALNYDFKDIDVISAQKIAEVSTELLDLAIHNAFTFKNKGMILQFLNKHPISIPLEIFAAFLRNANKIIEDSKTESLKFFIEALLDDKISLCGSARFMAFAPILLQEAFEKNKYIVSFIIKISGTNISKQLLNTFAHTAAEEIKKDGPNRKYCEAIFYEISQITSSDGKSPYLTMIHEICKEYHITLDGLHGFDDLEDPTTLDLR